MKRLIKRFAMVMAGAVMVSILPVMAQDIAPVKTENKLSKEAPVVAEKVITKKETISVNGKTVELRLKIPAVPAPGMPWLWLGEFFGHLDRFENDLVAKGWHVAYAPLSNQFGSPGAMASWDIVYQELHGKRGLSAKPALLGISRGALYANAWIRLHPDRVSVLYLDNGVCDIRSWPGGFPLTATGNGSKGDWTLYKTVFGFSTDDEAIAKSVRPIDGLAPAIKAGVVLISVHGTADMTVPYVDNAKNLVDLWEKSGGIAKVFPKEGGDHHPHGLPIKTDAYEQLVDMLCAIKQ